MAKKGKGPEKSKGNFVGVEGGEVRVFLCGLPDVFLVRHRHHMEEEKPREFHHNDSRKEKLLSE